MYFPHYWVNKLFSEENEVPRTTFQARKVAGSATYEQNSMKKCCPLRSVCLFSLFAHKHREFVDLVCQSYTLPHQFWMCRYRRHSNEALLLLAEYGFSYSLRQRSRTLSLCRVQNLDKGDAETESTSGTLFVRCGAQVTKVAHSARPSAGTKARYKIFSFFKNQSNHTCHTPLLLFAFRRFFSFLF